MKRHTLVLLILAIIVGFVAFWVFGTNKAAAPRESGSNEPSSGQVAKSASDNAAAEAASSDCAVATQPTITYDSSGFTPDCVTVASGTTITWLNKSSDEVELATNPHPEHTGNREVSSGEFVLPIPAGGQATSTLTTKTTHSYHNHLNPDASGRIIVQ